MSVTVTTDPDVIVRLLDARLAADPVRSTVLGTIRNGLTEDGRWCARSSSGGVAVRSARAYPVQVDGSWPAADLDALAAALTEVPGLARVAGPAALIDDLQPRLAERSLVASHRMAVRLFRLDRLRPPRAVRGQPRRAGAADRATLVDWFRAFADEAGTGAPDVDRAVDDVLASGGGWLWDDQDGAVSMAVRRPVVAGSARIGPVYTPPRYRGHGYGSAVTAAATADVLAEDAIPVLFTDLANPTSNAIYQQLGYEPVDDRLELSFR